MMDILIAMDASYMNNKYDYPGYTIKLPLRAYMDELVSVLFEEINSIVGALTPKHTLANLHVPEPVEQAFLHELKTPLSYTVVGLRKN